MSLKTLDYIWQTQEYWWSHISEHNDFDFEKTLVKKRIFSAPLKRVHKSFRIM